MTAISEKMKKVLEGLPGQLAFEPRIEHEDRLEAADSFVVGGMGGSHLSAELIRDCYRLPNVSIHSGYGLPNLPDAVSGKALFIAVSHSGNTEETIDFAEKALENGRPLAVISTGGKLISIAREKKLPHAVIPSDGIPPRFATGYIAAALLALMGMGEARADLGELAKKLQGSQPATIEEARALLATIGDRIPLVYSSAENRSLAYYLKICLNETAKRPAFWNVFSELNHNELAGFSVDGSGAPFSLVTIRDAEDHPRIRRRMDLTEKIIAGKGAATARIELSGDSRPERFWRMTALAAALGVISAESRSLEPFDTALIEAFKKDLS